MFTNNRKTNRHKARIFILLALTVLVASLFAMVIVQIVSIDSNHSLSSERTPLSSSIHTVSSHPNFKGIYQFAGHNSAKNSNNPSIQGTFLGYYWSQLEPQKDQYDWNLIDQDMHPWTVHGKRIILRVSLAGWTRWEPAAGHGTPQWVYDAGVTPVTEIDGSVIPQYWNLIFLQNVRYFIHAFGMHYDSNPNIALVEIGVGVGGETKVDTHNENPDRLQLWQNVGYTDEIWWNTIQNIIGMYETSFHTTPLAVLPDATFIGKTKGYQESLIINYALKHNLTLQDDSLSAKRTLPSIWTNIPHIEEQDVATKQSGDTLEQDIRVAFSLNANYILISINDIDNPDNRAILKQTMQKVAL